MPQELIKQVVRAGTYAATGMNRQSPIILAVTNKEMRDKLSKMNADIMCSDKDPFYGAPVVLVVLADKSVPTYVYDGSLVMGNMMLAAHHLGTGKLLDSSGETGIRQHGRKAILAQLAYGRL